jgi:acetyltransferase
MRIIGPNSFGIIRPNLNLYASFAEKKAVPGKIAFISQSGALCGSALDWSSETHVGFSAIVSTGSTIDVDLGDLIDYFGNDPQTRVIMLYVESIRNVRSFMSAARGYAKTKPIVIVKANRSNYCQNQLSEDSHFKAAIYDAAFRRCGIVQVETINDLFDCSKTLLMQSSPTAPYLTIVTNGGPALMALEQLNRIGGKLSQISETTFEALKKILPYYCNISHPIDIFEDATPERYRNVIETCLNDDASGSLLVVYTPIGLTEPQSLANILVDSVKRTSKNVFVCLMGEDVACQEARRMLQRQGVPVFRSSEEAVRTFMNIYTHGQNLELLYQTPEEVSSNQANPAHLKGILRRAFCEGRQALDLAESFQFLDAYKIPVEKTFIAKTAEESAVFASQLGYPVVMKTLDSTIDVCSASEIQEKFNRLIDNAKKSNDLAEFNGVAIQPKKSIETCHLFLRSRKDPQFGSVICLGTGVLGDIIKDLSVGFPPLNQVLARQMLIKTKALQYCNAIMDAGQFDARLVEGIVIKFSQLVVDFPEIKEINIDRLLISADSALVTDTQIVIDLDRIMREGAEHREHLAIAPYPKKYVTKRTLKNGAKVTLRPIKPEDEKRFNELFKSLSKESIRLRFFQMIGEMSHDTLSRYCNLDYDREIAIVAQLENDCRIIGVVRLILDVERENGEFAIMVGDAWHGLGLGSKLMDYIIDIAHDLKLAKIYSLVSHENYKMINLCSTKGFEIKPMDDYTVNVSIVLHP